MLPASTPAEEMLLTGCASAVGPAVRLCTSPSQAPKTTQRACQLRPLPFAGGDVLQSLRAIRPQ
eukprot:4412800-Amphidinium_carterae.1